MGEAVAAAARKTEIGAWKLAVQAPASGTASVSMSEVATSAIRIKEMPSKASPRSKAIDWSNLRKRRSLKCG